MSSLARWCHRHRLAVVLVWVGLLLVLGAGVGAAGSAFGNSPISQDTDSARATALLQKASDSAAGKSGRVVWQLNGKVTEPAAERTMTAALKDIADAPGVAAVTSPYTPAGKRQISEDGRTAYATVAFDEDVSDARIDHVKDLAAEAGTDSLHIALNGQAFTVNPEPNAVADAMGIILAFIVLLFVFRAVWVAALPIITAVVGVGTSAVTVILLSHVITLSDTTLTLGSLIGLGVGIDYALFIVNRHRGNLMSGMSVADSVAKSLNTSGRAVVFAGLTVVVALLGMLTLDVGIINGMAIGAAVTVVLTVLAALTLLPAMLGLIGPRVLSRRERGATAGRTRSRSAGRAGVWGRWAERVQARPKSLGLVALAVLTALAFPTLSLRLGASDDGNLPTTSTNRQAYDMIADGFGPGFNGPLVLAVQAPAPADKAAAARLVTALGEVDGVAGVGAAPMKDGQSVGVVSVVPTTSPQSAATSDLIHHLRDDVIPRAERGTSMKVYVGGVTASNDDFASVLMGKLPLFVLVIAALGFLLLAVAFRSLLVPAVGALLNILSIGVAFGAIVVVFQYGHGAGLLGLGSAGPIESFVPILVVGIMFGLSMDYQVFLVSRMREEWAHTGDGDRAVRVGQAETGKVIAVAATIMVCVFGSFVFGGMRVISEFGVSLAVAVAADALLIRMIVVPALMHLCGKANWWLPRRLDRALPNISVEGPADEPAPSRHPVRERETAGLAN
ncbi:MMPL family transporter [Streptomyces scabiei]|uniref:MMPL family transporter n=1 Tax=Streptomyces scabiei TaxID=1930 RepID=UPI00340FA6F4